MKDKLAKVREALADCSDDLAHEIEDRYRNILDYPHNKIKYDNEMVVVMRATKALTLIDEITESLDSAVCLAEECIITLQGATEFKAIDTIKGA